MLCHRTHFRMQIAQLPWSCFLSNSLFVLLLTVRVGVVVHGYFSPRPGTKNANGVFEFTIINCKTFKMSISDLKDALSDYAVSSSFDDVKWRILKREFVITLAERVFLYSITPSEEFMLKQNLDNNEYCNKDWENCYEQLLNEELYPELFPGEKLPVIDWSKFSCV